MKLELPFQYNLSDTHNCWQQMIKWFFLDSKVMLVEQFVRHDDVIKWKHFPHYWPFVWGIHQSRVNSPHKGQWRGTSMFSLIYSSTNDWVNNYDAGDLRCHHARNDVIVMTWVSWHLKLQPRWLWYHQLVQTKLKHQAPPSQAFVIGIHW